MVVKKKKFNSSNNKKHPEKTFESHDLLVDFSCQFLFTIL